MGRALSATHPARSHRDSHSRHRRRYKGDRSPMSKQPWALILGASSGFGAATALELARAGMNIFGVHLDARDKLARVEELQNNIRALGREAQFFNVNASDDDYRRDTIELIRHRLAQTPPGTVRVLLHSLAF